METLDYRGKRCPLPVIGLAKRLKDAPPQTTVRLLADDPAARVDIPAWCRMRSAELVSAVDAEDHVVYTVTQR
ncbi:sulfurtransferase TusA family protein [Natronoglycomyces albus]|uniref:Sulfurtransferase TusA family protein n=1 Tax=Natronoglycomyces albus TaxID=2811108 RepID=A0A895XXS7_9ACTN|nr:sulfurtransferase TusA family protein [Natronoglycomyces albus]QSB06428.1 sulfurtransferase TusA family protein [Natronoglycomyces albus]